MEFRLLGRLEAVHDGRPVDLGRRRERCLLGVLLLEPNTVVPADRLVDLLWDGRVPPTARASLHTHVSRLRSQLDPDGSGRGGARLVSRGGGYLVEVDEQSVDARRFQTLVAQARGTARPATVTLLRQALALWRGPVLADVASPLLRERVGAQLTELRMSATELLIDAEMAEGRHENLIGELVGLVAEHPYRERLTGQLMLALYRSDRFADALDAYLRLRERLARDLGVDPGPALRDLYTAMLRHDELTPAGTHPPARAPAHPPAYGHDHGPVPAQLPAAPAWFTGRAAELATLNKVLAGDSAPDHTMAVVAITGAGGIGKTWLALHWAHQHLGRYPDGQLFINLRGFDPSGQPTTQASAVRGFLGALGVPQASMPTDLDAQIGLYRSLVAGRRMLIVLDNARDSNQVAGLLPGSATCTVVVTSRDRLTGLVTGNSAHPVPLEVLDRDAAHGLLARRLGEDLLAAQPGAAARLVTGCAGLPLALGIVAAQVVARPGLHLPAIAAQLTGATTRLSALDGGDPQANLTAVLSWSHAALTPRQAELFALLGLAGGPDISLPAAAALAGRGAGDVAATLRALDRQSLLHEHQPGRWRMHDLVRLYAGQRAIDEQHAPRRHAALLRLVDFYLHTAYAADRLFNPHRSAIALDEPAPDAAPAALPDPATAQSWLEAEHACLLAAQRLADQQGWDHRVWQLAWVMDTLHHRRGYLYEELDAWQIGLTASQRTGDPLVQALALRNLGRVEVTIGRFADATGHLDRALSLTEQAGEVADQASIHCLLAATWERRGNDERALHHATRAEELYRLLDEPAGRAAALNLVGWYSARLGRHEQAHTCLEAGLALARRLRDPDIEAATLDSLGYLARHTGRPGAALDHYRQALAIRRDLGDTYHEADTLEHLGDTHADLSQPEHAARHWGQALLLYQAQRRAAEARRIGQRLDV